MSGIILVFAGVDGESDREAVELAQPHAAAGEDRIIHLILLF